MDNTRPIIVLLRGLIREREHWMTFADKLALKLPNYKVITIDIAGNGSENKAITPTNIPNIRRELTERFNKSYPESTHIILIAISLGGMIAADWANKEPERIDKIVLINSSFADLAPFHKRLKWQNYFQLLTGLFLPKREKEKRLLKLTTNLTLHQKQQDNIIDSWVDISTQRPVSFTNLVRQLIAAAHYQLPIVEQPVLILASEKDKLVDVISSKKLAKRWRNTELQIHQTAGHDLPLDDPEWVIRNIEWYLKIKN